MPGVAGASRVPAALRRDAGRRLTARGKPVHSRACAVALTAQRANAFPLRINRPGAGAMTRQIAMTDEASINPRFADAFVIFSVTLLSLAFGAWFLLRLGLTLWAGMVAALAVYSALLSVHLIARRSLLVSGDEEDMERASMHWSRAVARASKLPEPRPKDTFSFRPSREPTMAPPAPEAPSAPPAGLAPDAGMAAERHEAEEPAQSETMSVELIQDLIKKLADELNGTPAPAPERSSKLEPANATEALIGQSVAALQSVARAWPRSPPRRRSPGRRPRPSPRRLPPAARGGPRSSPVSPVQAARPRPASERAADPQSARRAHRRGDCGGAHGGAARADPCAGRGAPAPLRGERAAADRRRRDARAERVRARRQGLRPDAAASTRRA